MAELSRARIWRTVQAGLATVALTGIILASPIWQPRAEARAAAQPTPPPAVTAFLEAYGRGDELAADALASPLYRAEWARRGLSAQERARLAGASSADAASAPARLSFS